MPGTNLLASLFSRFGISYYSYWIKLSGNWWTKELVDTVRTSLTWGGEKTGFGKANGKL